MQTGTAGLQNIFDIDSIESRYENGLLGIESGSRKNAYGDLEETFQLEFMAQHTPPNHEKRQVNETMNEKTSVAKDNDTGINKNPKVLKAVDSETGKLDKIQIDEKISNESLKHKSDIATKAHVSRSESGAEVNEKGNVKSGEQNQLSSGIVGRKTDPQIEGQPRAVELAAKKIDSLKKEIAHLQDKLSHRSENEPHARFINSSSTKTPTVVTSLDTWQKYMNLKSGVQKSQILEGNLDVSKVINLETNDGEETKFASNNQTADKNLESVVQTKELSHFQRQFQPDVMRQLVEKAIFGIKNGRSLIKINLKPESLGHLRIQISTENNQVAVRIITEVPMVKEMIESNLNQLRTDLQNQGLEIEKFDVHVDHGSTQNDRNPSRIPIQNDEDRTGEEKVKNSLSEEVEVTVQNVEKGEKTTLIDFFA